MDNSNNYDGLDSRKPETILSNNFRDALQLPRPNITMPSKLRILEDLKRLGVSRFGLMRMNSRFLHKVIHPFEHLQAVVYGRSQKGSGIIVATDSRVVYLDKKPLFVNYDEITYDVVAGVSYGRAGLSSSVTLHTRMGDYTLHTMNVKCADRFVNYIESRCLVNFRTGDLSPSKLLM